MIRLKSHLCGAWADGGATTATLVNPATEEAGWTVASGPASFADAVAYARNVGGPALRALTFRQRGELLRAMSKTLHAHRDELIGLGLENAGNTRGDAKFDIDGASGTLAFYANLADTLGDKRLIVEDGEGVQLLRSPRYYGQHVLAPREGVAVHINAFNFPAWGPAEKAACALLAGMPVITKPATATAVVTFRMVELFVEQNLLPAGALQLLLGPVGDLFDHLGGQDVVAFTGSSDTGARIRGHQKLVSENVRVNVEADSLNAAVLGPDVEPGTPTWDLFVADVFRDLTQKSGQKCTAIRRVFVPATLLERVQEALVERLGSVRVGAPSHADVTMGPLATASQLKDAKAGLAKLRAEAEPVFGGDGSVTALGADGGKGFYFGPVLLVCAKPEAAQAVHSHEVFGPVQTLLPYDGSAASVASLVRRGGGGLVASAYSDDRDFLAELVVGVAAHHGRLYIGSSKIADKTPGPGTVLPSMVHGGPGRAGAGEELGGMRGLAFYQQRTAVQGDKQLLAALLGQ